MGENPFASHSTYPTNKGGRFGCLAGVTGALYKTPKGKNRKKQ